MDCLSSQVSEARGLVGSFTHCVTVPVGAAQLFAVPLQRLHASSCDVPPLRVSLALDKPSALLPVSSCSARPRASLQAKEQAGHLVSTGPQGEYKQHQQRDEFGNTSNKLRSYPADAGSSTSCGNDTMHITCCLRSSGHDSNTSRKEQYPLLSKQRCPDPQMGFV